MSERRASFLLVGGCLGVLSATMLAVCAGCFVLLERSTTENQHVIPADEQERRFREHRTTFDDHIRRLEEIRAKGERGLPELSDELREIGILYMKERASGKIVLFEWRSHSLDSDHYIGFCFDAGELDVTVVHNALGGCHEVRLLGGRWFRAVCH